MKLNKLAFIGALTVATLSSQAFAAQDATVNFNARLVAETCDVSASKDLISLGTHKTQGLSTTDAISNEKFSLVLNNCTKAYDDQNPQAGSIAIQASGEVLTGHADMFADAQASQIGVKLQAEPVKDTKIALKPNEATEITGLKVSGQGDIVVPMIASLYATTADATAQQLNVPVTFSVAYD
ncbi:fimbrial protein [Providencia vermicola]|uniref:fimbrial protein n=1 Tax=Providencia vermicola TaxID=333965 RepID=UPI001CED0F74|nr:fimbrial protein [Providencia vermicola]